MFYLVRCFSLGSNRTSFESVWGVLIRLSWPSLLLFCSALLSPACLVPHRLCGETLLFKNLFKRLRLMNKVLNIWISFVLCCDLIYFDWVNWWWSQDSGRDRWSYPSKTLIGFWLHIIIGYSRIHRLSLFCSGKSQVLYFLWCDFFWVCSIFCTTWFSVHASAYDYIWISRKRNYT